MRDARISLTLTLTVPNPPIWIRFCTHSRGVGLKSFNIKQTWHPRNGVVYCMVRMLYTDGLVGWLVGWLIGWLVGWLVDWLVDWLIDWLIGWLVDWLIGWLVGWLIDWLISLIQFHWFKLIDWFDCFDLIVSIWLIRFDSIDNCFSVVSCSKVKTASHANHYMYGPSMLYQSQMFTVVQVVQCQGWHLHHMTKHARYNISKKLIGSIIIIIIIIIIKKYRRFVVRTYPPCWVLKVRI